MRQEMTRKRYLTADVFPKHYIFKEGQTRADRSKYVFNLSGKVLERSFSGASGCTNERVASLVPRTLNAVVRNFMSSYRRAGAQERRVRLNRAGWRGSTVFLLQ